MNVDHLNNCHVHGLHDNAAIANFNQWAVVVNFTVETCVFSAKINVSDCQHQNKWPDVIIIWTWHKITWNSIWLGSIVTYNIK